jgi:putative ABC transport system substrate-binding protein
MPHDQIKRREFISLLGGAATIPLFWPHAARAQQERVRRLGVLYDVGANDPVGQRGHAAFLSELQQLHWQDGRNVGIDVRYAAGNPDQMQVYAKELVGLKPDLIFARSTAVVAALLHETQAIPLVFVGVSDPVGSGFVASLEQPARNVTGFANAESSTGGKWVELLREVAPDVTRTVVVFNPPTSPGGGSFYMKAIEAAAQAHAITPIAAPVLNDDDVERAMTDLVGERDGGLVVTADAFTVFHRERIIALAARHRLPAVYGFDFIVKDGGLISYGVDIVDQYRQAASYADRILKGEKPANLRVQAPAKFDVTINLKTAKALGLTLPATLLGRANEVIE